MKRVLVVDTSMLCVWLKIPGKDTCGSDDDKWDFDRVDAKIASEIKNGATLVLPMATLIETGNHIAQSDDKKRFQKAKELGNIIKQAADETSPWAAFNAQDVLWSNDELHRIARDWPGKAAERISIGDFTISAVANFYAGMGRDVEILTGDHGLKSLSPIKAERPRRRSER
ncbi:MAG: hypothetical protein ACLQMF_11915 [Rectinemataceae bacterium]